MLCLVLSFRSVSFNLSPYECLLTPLTFYSVCDLSWNFKHSDLEYCLKLCQALFGKTPSKVVNRWVCMDHDTLLHGKPWGLNKRLTSLFSFVTVYLFLTLFMIACWLWVKSICYSPCLRLWVKSVACWLWVKLVGCWLWVKSVGCWLWVKSSLSLLKKHMCKNSHFL